MNNFYKKDFDDQFDKTLSKNNLIRESSTYLGKCISTEGNVSSTGGNVSIQCSSLNSSNILAYDRCFTGDSKPVLSCPFTPSGSGFNIPEHENTDVLHGCDNNRINNLSASEFDNTLSNRIKNRSKRLNSKAYK